MKQSRRQFLSASALSVAPLILGSAGVRKLLAADDKPQQSVHIFSKHLQWLDYKGMAETAAEVGFDGVDLTVRPRGHVLPERAVDDLPKAVEAVKKAGIKVMMMTTAITDPQDPLTEPILKTASRLGVRYYRTGYYRYDRAKSVPATLDEIRPRLRDLAAMNAHYGIAASYQNHAGDGYVGAPLWDLQSLLKDINPRWFGCQYDIRHATVEGGTSWPTTLRLLAPHINTLVAKDFLWAQRDGKWRTENCPLGQGMVDFPKYFSMLDDQKIAVPFSLHLEYSLGGAEHGARELTISKQQATTIIRKDLITLKAWLNKRSL